MSKFITREDLGWPESAARRQPFNPKGVKIHYEGTYVPKVEHSKCKSRWTAIRNSHLANKQEGYADVAYNLAVCQHGYILEGRGAGHQTGANGNQELNAENYAVLVMIGSEGDTRPTAEAVVAIREAIRYLRTHSMPAGKSIKGHRDGFATSCPGGPLYTLVGNGSLEPDKYVPPKPSPVYASFPGAAFFKIGKTSPLFTEVGKALVRAGFKGYKVGPSPEWGPADERGIKWFQEKQGWSGADADGKPGPVTWKLLKVSKP
jgi:hypothetical protein